MKERREDKERKSRKLQQVLESKRIHSRFTSSKRNQRKKQQKERRQKPQQKSKKRRTQRKEQEDPQEKAPTLKDKAVAKSKEVGLRSTVSRDNVTSGTGVKEQSFWYYFTTTTAPTQCGYASQRTAKEKRSAKHRPRV